MVDAAAGAEELEGVRDPAHVELHRVGVDPDRDGPVLHEPLGHLRLVGGHADAAGDGGTNLAKISQYVGYWMVATVAP